MSNMEVTLNKLVLYIIPSQILLCSILAANGWAWMRYNTFQKVWLINDTLSDLERATISFFTYFLLMSTLLPISLQVSLEIIKVVQGYFISHDAVMFSFERN